MVKRSVCKLSGYEAAEVVGRPLDELVFGPSTDKKTRQQVSRAIDRGDELTTDVLQYRRDGTTLWVECKLIPVNDDRGELSRWIVIESDVSRRKQTEDALLAAKQSAEASSRSKSEFLVNMSHEIRTLLNAILGMTELALTTELTREQRDYMRTVKASGDTLLNLLNDVLDISKIEASKMEIEEVDFNLAEVVRETTKALAVRAHEKGLELAVHMPMRLPQDLRGDPTRIRQVLLNLIGNAIKFTESGEVVIDVVLMDVQMPGRDGFSATRKIREIQRLSGSCKPIIALTAHALQGDREKCLAAGMDSYLAKPIHAADLIELVEQTACGQSQAKVDMRSPSGTAKESFSIDAALERMGGEMDLLREHIGYVLNDMPQLMSAMRQALEESDAKQLEIAAHRLKSLVGSYDHAEARELAQQIKQDAKRSRLSDAGQRIEELGPLVRAFARAVDDYLQSSPPTPWAK